MKILYLETKKKNFQEDFSKFETSQLPKTLLLVYSIQYQELAKQIKTRLEKAGFKITGFQQVLGCSKLKSQSPILLIGSGKFHALNLGIQNNVPIYIYSNNQITLLDKKAIEDLRQRKTGSYSKFLHAKSLGIIVTTKPGQENLAKAISLKEKIIKKFPQKEVFIFLSNNINLNELENFSIDFWINTACPGLFYDTNKVINIDDISEFLK